MESNGKFGVIVVHGCALVAAGIVATLSGGPDIEVADRTLRRSIEPEIVIGSGEEAVKSLSFGNRHIGWMRRSEPFHHSGHQARR